MTYAILGWLSVSLLTLLILPYVLVRLNKQFIHTKDKRFLGVIRFLRKLHKPAGILLLVAAGWHGYLALFGRIRWHTGTVLFILVLITVSLGGAFFRLKKRKLFSFHKLAALLTVLMFILHFFFPYLFS